MVAAQRELAGVVKAMEQMVNAQAQAKAVAVATAKMIEATAVAAQGRGRNRRYYPCRRQHGRDADCRLGAEMA